jgi:hypothetical protein
MLGLAAAPGAICCVGVARRAEVDATLALALAPGISLSKLRCRVKPGAPPLALLMLKRAGSEAGSVEAGPAASEGTST